MNDKALTVFCPVWGAHHHDLLERYCLPSLMLPGNLPDLGVDKIYVDIMGVHHEFEHTKRLFQEQCGNLPIEIRQIGMVKADRDLAEGMLDCMSACRQRQTRMFLAMPDTIYGPRSVTNLFNYSKGKNVVVAAAHVRVSEKLFDSQGNVWRLWPQNRDFVRSSFAMKALWNCDTNKENVTHVGGIAWTTVNEDTRLMLHYLPTAYMMWVTEQDIRWFSNNLNFSNIDHRWPAELIPQRRWRVIGSTDVFFAIELEGHERSQQLQPFPNTIGGELYNGRHLHMDTCGCFLIEIRG